MEAKSHTDSVESEDMACRGLSNLIVMEVKRIVWRVRLLYHVATHGAYLPSIMLDYARGDESDL